MRVISDALRSALAADATTLALCARIVCRDGVALGFTTHDRPVTLGGVRHDPSPGFSPSAVDLGGHGPEAGELVGALDGATLVESDFRAGRLDNARVTITLADWAQPEAGELVLVSGRIGRIEVRDGQFAATLRSALTALEAIPIQSCSPQCRAELGDPRCRINLAARRIVTRATDVSGAIISYDGEAGSDGAFGNGRLRVLSGAASGLSESILASNTGEVSLAQPIEGLAAGNLVELKEGCDKRFATCRDRFGNALNFQGEPHVPGGDSITRYGGL